MTTDRVTYGLSMKINMGNYENADVHASMSTDLKDGETVEDAYKRAVAYVEAQVEKKYSEVKEL